MISIRNNRHANCRNKPYCCNDFTSILVFHLMPVSIDKTPPKKALSNKKKNAPKPKNLTNIRLGIRLSYCPIGEKFRNYPINIKKTHNIKNSNNETCNHSLVDIHNGSIIWETNQLCNN